MENSSIVTTVQPFITALTGAVSPADIVALLAACVGVGATLYLVWFGARKALSAFKKGLHGKFGV